jgi:NAD(P)-dependent dehydrogenase (short-subunit alcohol dehydrogenase family)
MRANVVAPALVKTKIYEDTKEAYNEQEIKNITDQYPLGIGEAMDVAQMIVFLLSENSKWITGTTINMDGGLLLSSKK